MPGTATLKRFLAFFLTPMIFLSLCPACSLANDDLALTESDNPLCDEDELIVSEFEMPEFAELTIDFPEESMISEDEPDDIDCAILNEDIPEELPELTEVHFTEEKTSFAEGNKCGENLTWSLDSEDPTVLTISGTGMMDNFSQGNSPWFPYADTVTKVVIHDGVTSIGSYAFSGMEAMTELSIPDTIGNIGIYAFYKSHVVNITIPAGVTKIGTGTFMYCANLETVTLPAGVESIGDYAFSECDDLRRVSLAAGLTCIGERAFSGCIRLSDITIPPSATAFGLEAFIYCDSLESITIPEGTALIPKDMFYHCTSLKNVSIPGSVTEIGMGAFAGCTDLAEVVYHGSREDWDRIEIGTENDLLNNLLQYTDEVVTLAYVYVWSEDCSTVYVKRGTDIISSAVSKITGRQPPTCEQEGSITYTASFSNPSYQSQTKTVTVPATGHSWGEWRVTKAATEAETGVETHVCGHDETHTETRSIPKLDHRHSLTLVPKVEPTCLTAGHIAYYLCSACGKEFKDPEGGEQLSPSEKGIEATGHDWDQPSYTWAEDFSAVTATRCCKHDESHTESETVNVTDKKKREVTCEEDGTLTCTSASFSNPAFKVQQKTVIEEKATGHNWGEWQVTKPATETEEGVETRFCLNNASHTIPRPIPKIGHVHSLTLVERVEATCERPGHIAYYACSGCSALFADEEGKQILSPEETAIAPLGHDWAEPVYTWAEDCSTVTAGCTCKRDETHTEEETVTATSSVTLSASCGYKGKTTYTATFENPAFSTRSRTVDNLPELEHDWADPVYIWSEDNSTVTASRICRNDPARSHAVTETVETTKTVSKEATCKAEGQATFTAVFQDSVFAKQIKTATLPKLSHKTELKGEKAATCKETGYTGDLICTLCGETLEKGTVTPIAQHHAAEPQRENEVSATCTEDGTCIEVVLCTDCKTELSRTEKKTDKLGHSPGTPVRENTVPATATTQGSYEEVVYCTRCKAELSREKKTLGLQDHEHQTELKNKKEATCEEAGYSGDLVCTVCNGLIEAGHETEKLGHLWGDVMYFWSEDNLKVTAVRVCTKDGAHSEVETSDAYHAVTSKATCTSPGETTWYAFFKNEAFLPQKKIVQDAPAPGHKTLLCNEKTATQAEPGYTGDEICVVCGEIVKRGEVIPVSDSVAAFVQRCYSLIMDRDGESDGVAYWSSLLKNNQTGGADLVRLFCSSDEFKNKHLSDVEAVTILYQTMLNRLPEEDGLRYWVSFLKNGATLDDVIDGFSASPEFYGICASYGINTGYVPPETQYINSPVAGFVNRCYQCALNRNADPSGLNNWTQVLLSGRMTPQQVAYHFVFSSEFTALNLDNRDFIERLYLLYLDRIADYEGLQYWSTWMEKGVTRQIVVDCFAASPEFQGIVRSFGL